MRGLFKDTSIMKDTIFGLILSAVRFVAGAAGWEAQRLPPCNAVPQRNNLEDLVAPAWAWANGASGYPRDEASLGFPKSPFN